MLILVISHIKGKASHKIVSDGKLACFMTNCKISATDTEGSAKPLVQHDPSWCCGI